MIFSELKVAKVCDENEKIDLLRNTSLSLFKENILGEFLKMFNGELNQDINRKNQQQKRCY